ncbi:sigma-70 family RNA polymerase sigma factor [Pedobacter sp. ASV28]|uniref:sigma-70 family RNA polymerase sigma factor n=1 Tax=Pedobacter sp. ASV28 TaxID=2795123 RepID=UPI0018EAD918|nr:sigma-70 family RNA polymerase sigma factor [Pedobacter sp. ASV28]
MASFPKNSLARIEFDRLLISEIDNLKLLARRFTSDSDEIKDLVQETILKASRFWHTFESGTHLKKWLHVIMKNSFINGYRKLRRSQNYCDVVRKVQVANFMEQGVEGGVQSKLIFDDLSAALAQLPKDQSVPFQLYFEGFKYMEIAQKLCKPMGTIKTNIYQARKVLKHMLKDYGTVTGR